MYLNRPCRKVWTKLELKLMQILYENTTPNSDLAVMTRLTAVGPVWRTYRSFWSHNFFIQTPNWAFYICIPIASMISTQWFSPIDNLIMWPWPVCLIYITGLTSLLNCSTNLNCAKFVVSNMAIKINVVSDSHILQDVSIATEKLKIWIGQNIMYVR